MEVIMILITSQRECTRNSKLDLQLQKNIMIVIETVTSFVNDATEENVTNVTTMAQYQDKKTSKNAKYKCK